MPAGSVEVTIVIGTATARVKVRLTVPLPPASATDTAKLAGPGAAGVPLIDPPLLNCNPAGSEPELTVQEYAPVPPLATRD